jgi:hypothetical protein
VDTISYRIINIDHDDPSNHLDSMVIALERRSRRVVGISHESIIQAEVPLEIL